MLVRLHVCARTFHTYSSVVIVAYVVAAPLTNPHLSQLPTLQYDFLHKSTGF